ncbi:esterase B1-like [Anopheles cruzii]|uniref:esterase B1-like n=1 Tax=Anopheles cruzii TaxID=68878 RepID=UPI0022EC7BC4|nr:esterase B1-like [Anopheles cruzii]
MAESKVTIALKAGTIIGQKGTLPNGSDSFVFKGIPYAEPPINELRFKSPVPLVSFASDPLECLADGPSCWADDKMFDFPSVGHKSEDCLYLNVFSPDLHPKALLPVMVWIHGGGFFVGSGHSALYDPEYIVQQGVVVVSINYRLGPLGFLSLPGVGITGNMGLKDQRLSFVWVNDNIERFGGDPNNVTIFGESAGGASVHLHYLSEGSRKYFHKAIAQSGTAFNDWVWQREPGRRARKLARLFGNENSDSDEDVLASLMEASAEKLNTIQFQALNEYEQAWMLCFPFSPVVEPPDTVDAILTEHPAVVAKRRFAKEIPLVLGTAKEEALGLWAMIEAKFSLFQNDPFRLLPATLNVSDEEGKKRAAELTKEFFLKDRSLSLEHMKDIIPILSDNFNTFPFYVAAELHARVQRAPLYCYVFSCSSELNVFRKFLKTPPNETDAAHGDDMYYLFSSTVFNTAAVEEHSEAAQLRKFICGLWADLARNGNPSSSLPSWMAVPRLDDDLKEFQLPAMELCGLEQANSMVPDCFSERFKFWKKLYAMFNGSHLLPNID